MREHRFGNRLVVTTSSGIPPYQAPTADSAQQSKAEISSSCISSLRYLIKDAEIIQVL